MKINCFMCMPTHHQGAFYRELNKLSNLTVYFENSISDSRKKMGWDEGLDGYNHEYLTSQKTINFEKNSFYFLSGIPGSLRNLRWSLFKQKNHVAFQSEMPFVDDFSFKCKTGSKLLKYVLNARRIPFLGIGEDIRNYYCQLGLDKNLIFPFAYFIKSSPISQRDFGRPLVYVGQLIKRKRVDLLIEAYSRSHIAHKKELVLVGDGDERENLAELAARLGVQKCVRFCGTVKAGAVDQFIRNSSCLVLPSDHDGWGVTVNEAINKGIPVLVSDGCGSKDFVSHLHAGHVFKKGSVESLKDKINLIYENETQWSHICQNAEAGAKYISAEAGAKYFFDIVKFTLNNYSGKRPVAPWIERG